MSLLDKFPKEIIQEIVKESINLEAIPIIGEIDKLEKRLEELQNPKNLMEWAIISSNKALLEKHRGKVEKIKEQIASLEKDLEAIKHNKSEGFESKEEEEHYEPEHFPYTELEEFDFADDIQTSDKQESLMTEFEWNPVTDLEVMEQLMSMPKVKEFMAENEKEHDIKLAAYEQDMEEGFKKYVVYAYFLDEPEGTPYQVFSETLQNLGASKVPMEEEFVDDIQTFAKLANIFDKRGFYNAANKVDEFIKKLSAKKCDHNRKIAAYVRYQKKNNIKVAQVDVGALAQRLRLDPNVLKQLTQQQLAYINRIRNISIARQWVTKFRQHMPQRMPTQPRVEQLPTRAPQPQRMPSGLTQKDMPQALTEKDMPQALTEKDMPQALTEKDFGG